MRKGGRCKIQPHRLTILRNEAAASDPALAPISLLRQIKQSKILHAFTHTAIELDFPAEAGGLRFGFQRVGRIGAKATRPGHGGASAT